MWIFLDFDGVINSRRYALTNPSAATSWLEGKLFFEPRAMSVLNEIQRRSNAYVVISSNWRKRYGLPELRRRLVGGGFRAPHRVVSATPDFGAVPRGHEIYAWMQKMGQGRPFVILDDRGDM